MIGKCIKQNNQNQVLFLLIKFMNSKITFILPNLKANQAQQII